MIYLTWYIKQRCVKKKKTQQKICQKKEKS